MSIDTRQLRTLVDTFVADRGFDVEDVVITNGADGDAVVVTVDRHANTSAASVPLALDVAVRDGRIHPTAIVVLEAMGGGFTWGAAVLRF